MSATWLAAAGVRLSAAITATILCPSGPHAHAAIGQSKKCENQIRNPNGPANAMIAEASVYFLR